MDDVDTVVYGFEIFAKYTDDRVEDVSSEDIKKLAEIGWYVDSYAGTFNMYV